MLSIRPLGKCSPHSLQRCEYLSMELVIRIKTRHSKKRHVSTRLDSTRLGTRLSRSYRFELSDNLFPRWKNSAMTGFGRRPILSASATRETHSLQETGAIAMAVVSPLMVAASERDAKNLPVQSVTAFSRFWDLLGKGKAVGHGNCGDVGDSGL